jgi:hypothetical protein
MRCLSSNQIAALFDHGLLPCQALPALASAVDLRDHAGCLQQ